MAHLFLVPHCQDRYGIRVDALAGHVSAIAEVDDPLAEVIGQVLNGSSYPGLLLQQLDALADGFHRPFGRVRVRGSEEAIEALQIEQRRRSPD